MNDQLLLFINVIIKYDYSSIKNKLLLFLAIFFFAVSSQYGVYNMHYSPNATQEFYDIKKGNLRVRIYIVAGGLSYQNNVV